MNNDQLARLNVVRLEDLRLDKKRFACGVDSLDNYLNQYASQDVKKGLATCFVLIDDVNIVGYYTLSALSVEVADIASERIKKRIPYPYIPAVLLGRLAIDQKFKQQGFGKFLIADAIYKIKQGNIGAMLLVVDAENDDALAFYQRLGFVEFSHLDRGYRKLFYPLTKIIQ